MRILAVEDEPEYLEMLQEVMSSLGHTILIVPNGHDALAMLDKQRIDVVVSDVRMPEMSGVEFHQKLRAHPDYRNTPFIFLTGIDDLTEVRSVCSKDFDLILQKPFPIDKLLKMFSGQMK